MKRVLKFASDNGLNAAEINAASGRILLKGKAEDFNNAFNVRLEEFQTPQGKIQEYAGTISVPLNIARDLEAVFGLDTRAQVSPRYRLSNGATSLDVRSMSGEVADAYEFPKESLGQGQSVAILQFNGGLELQDNSQYYREHGLKDCRWSIGKVKADLASQQISKDNYKSQVSICVDGERRAPAPFTCDL